MAGNDCSIRIGLFSPVIEQCPGQAPRVIEVSREEAAALSFFLKQTLKPHVLVACRHTHQLTHVFLPTFGLRRFVVEVLHIAELLD